MLAEYLQLRALNHPGPEKGTGYLPVGAVAHAARFPDSQLVKGMTA